MISQHCFRQWLGAVRHQAITWANVDPDLCRCLVSLGHNELINLCVLKGFEKIWRYISMVSITCQNLGGARIWNVSSMMSRSSLSYIVNAMAADDLVTEGARASTAMVLTSFSLLHSGFRVKVNTVAMDVSVSMTLEHPKLQGWLKIPLISCWKIHEFYCVYKICCIYRLPRADIYCSRKEKQSGQLSPSSCIIQAEPWWRASIWRSHRKVVIKQCSYHNNIIDIQNRLPYSKVVYPAIIVLFPCLMEVNHGVRTGPDYPFIAS